MSAQPTWAEIEKALENAVTIAAGIPAIWGHQSSNQPVGDYVRMTLGAVATVGVDFVNERYDATRPDHQQIVQEVGGVREVALQLEAWSAAVVDTAAQATARAVLDGVVSRLRLPAARTAFRAVGVTPFDPGPVNWLPEIVQVGFRGRAVCDIRCRMPARALEEYADWIASIGVGVTAKGGASGDIAFPVDAP